jgi:hypothetical protein
MMKKTEELFALREVHNVALFQKDNDGFFYVPATGETWCVGWLDGERVRCLAEMGT